MDTQCEFKEINNYDKVDSTNVQKQVGSKTELKESHKMKAL